MYMKILFCHDGPINCDEKNRYYSIGFNDKILSRYEDIFGEVGFVTRVERDVASYVESDKLSVDRFRVIEYPNYLTLKGLFADKSKSNKLLEEEISGCDALIIRLPSFLGSKCVKIARKYNKPFLIEMVGCPWDSLRNHGITGKVLAPYMYLKTKMQVKNATNVLYVTNKFLQRRYPTIGKQVGCSDVELLSVDSGIIDRSSNVRENDKRIIIGTVGKIDLKYKGHATVIKAAKILKSKGYDVHYQIVGPGEKNYLGSIIQESGMSNNVTLVGSMGHDEIFNWLDTIDVYVQPSLTEGMPRALIEAMSRGCPCVASNAGGMPELLEEKYIFKKGNAKQLADILMKSQSNGLYVQSARNAEFTKQFAPEIIKEKRETFYTEFKMSIMGR